MTIELKVINRWSNLSRDKGRDFIWSCRQIILLMKFLKQYDSTPLYSRVANSVTNCLVLLVDLFLNNDPLRGTASMSSLSFKEKVFFTAMLEREISK